ncbi:peptidylprolyl isomerase [Siphonobacter curvatus]|uniref:peptidylprolyl isomerase n=1 Tax=Siphonobacter curvatus TaxID=2094562 RepID=A0A2S7ILT4_9BACT|nr:peptidylprolyl isomerase [Siphonobacter curvatus]PQA58694.1 peptidylprolyl isomerase [Siphonobacter curvatus]
MRNLLLFCLGLVVFSACKNREIPQDEVVQTLTEYGKEHPENRVSIHTRFGDIEIKLYDETPLHRANFIRMINSGYYDDRGFYRLVKGVCIQGGGEQRDQLNYTVPSEFRPNLIHKKGTLSMARYSDNNPEKRSSSTEFFIVTKGIFYNEEELAKYPPALKSIYLKQGGEIIFDQEYTVFGEVTKGLDIVDKIAQMPLGGFERPTEIVKFSMKVLD